MLWTALAKRQTVGLVLTESTYAGGLRLPRHTHTRMSFCLVLHGQFIQTHGPKELECQPYTVLACPPGECHADRFSAAGARCFILEANARWLAQIEELSPRAFAPGCFQGGETAWLMTRMYREFQRMDVHSPLVVEGLALELAGETVRSTYESRHRQKPRWLARVRELLHVHFREPLSLHGLAHEAGVHVTHLARAFRRSFGCTVGDYLRRLRIQTACRQLETPHLSLVEIALANGFAHQGHFCTAFKKITGLTPGQYRKAFRRR
jgi:AraC family transcriptional regulator